MNLNKETIDEISNELGIAPAFIEKDYYVFQVLKILLSCKDPLGIDINFSGGTSLSKGYKLIDRFSEDIDFMIQTKEVGNKSYNKCIKEKIISEIEKLYQVDKENQIIRDDYRFFSFYVNYPKLYEQSNLRPQVQVEISIKNLRQNSEEKELTSFVDGYIKSGDKILMNCVSPLETAANKFSALLWRINCKDRTKNEKKYNDPTMIRHLYDLYKLKSIIAAQSSKFKELIYEIYEVDKKRGNKEDADLTLADFSKVVLEKINNDPEYENEYNNFVNNMIYSSDRIVAYNDSLAYFENLISSLF